MRALRTKSQRAAALGAVLALTGAGSAAAFVGGPGNGDLPKTSGPDLVSATLTADNVVGSRQAVTFCFDKAVTPVNAVFFNMQTYDSDRVIFGDTALNAENTNNTCVEVEFDPNFDLRQASVASIDDGALQADGEPNYFSSVPVTGSALAPRAGQSTGPDLVSATPRANDSTVLFTFDQPIDPTQALLDAAVADNRFQAVNNQGVSTPATAAVVEPESNQLSVRATFPDTTEVQNRSQYAVSRGAVQTRPQDNNLDDAGNPGDADSNVTLGTPGSVARGTQQRPVLSGVTPRADGQFILDYSADLGTFPNTGILAVLDNGQVVQSISAQTFEGNIRRKIVGFPADSPAKREPSAVVAIVSPTGTASTNNGNEPSPVSSFNLPPSGNAFKVGYTTAPDLLRTNVDTNADQAQFIYDETVDPQTIGGAGEFVLLPADGGDPIPGNQVVGIGATAQTVVVSYSGDIGAGAAVGNGQGAAKDLLANNTPYGSVSTSNIPVPPTGEQPNPTTPPVTNPPVTNPPVTNPPTNNTRTRRKGSIRGIKSPGRRIKGRIKVAGRTCKSGRRVVIKKGKKTVGSGRTNRAGRFNIKTKKHKKGKLTVVIRSKSTSSTACGKVKKRVPGRN